MLDHTPNSIKRVKNSTVLHRYVFPDHNSRNVWQWHQSFCLPGIGTIHLESLILSHYIVGLQSSTQSKWMSNTDVWAANSNEISQLENYSPQMQYVCPKPSWVAEPKETGSEKGTAGLPPATTRCPRAQLERSRGTKQVTGARYPQVCNPTAVQWETPSYTC